MKRIIKSGFAALGYHVQRKRDIPRQLAEPALLRNVEFDDIVCRRMVECGPEFVFIQVGAFDGVLEDPLRKYIEAYHWRGVLAEPQAKAVTNLRQLYNSNSRITILQAGIDRRAGRKTLFTVAGKDAPDWAGGMASFNREVILNHSGQIADLATMIKEEPVDCISFEQVLNYLPVGQLDLLQIDAEGADDEIIAMFPFESTKPAIIHWEIKHLDSAKQEDTLTLLSARGYRFAYSGDDDMLAVLG